MIPTTLAKAPGNVNIPDMDNAARKTILRRFPYGLYAVTVAHDGALLLTEDGNGTMWRIAYAGFE